MWCQKNLLPNVPRKPLGVPLRHKTHQWLVMRPRARRKVLKRLTVTAQAPMQTSAAKMAPLTCLTLTNSKKLIWSLASWLEKLSRVKKSWCSGICRFSVLRWALNQDDDVWLSLRGTRHNQPCQICGQPTDIYPMGFWHSPICETCVRSQAIVPAGLYPDTPALFDLYRYEQLTMAPRDPS